MRKITEQYYRPTPKFYRKLGDALLAVSTFVTGFAIYEEFNVIAIIALVVGVFGKFLSNFFSED